MPSRCGPGTIMFAHRSSPMIRSRDRIDRVATGGVEELAQRPALPRPVLGPPEVADPDVADGRRAREHRAAGGELAANPLADPSVGESLERPVGAALLDPERHQDEERGARPLVRVGVEGDVQPFGVRVVDHLEQAFGRARHVGEVIEVGQVRGDAAAPADVDRLEEGVEEPVAKRIAHVGVVDPAEPCDLLRQRRPARRWTRRRWAGSRGRSRARTRRRRARRAGSNAGAPSPARRRARCPSRSPRSAARHCPPAPRR